MPQDVFISYRSEDKSWADRLCETLERQNITCWMAPRDVTPAREWAEAIVDAIQHCKAFVLVLSSNSLQARQISREAELADRQGLPIFTFRVENVDPPPGLMYFLGNLQWVDAFGGKFDAAAACLVEVLGKTSGTATRTPLPAPVPLPPIPVATQGGLPLRNILIGVVAAAILALGAWLIPNRKPVPAPPQPNPTAGAKVEVEKYLNALKASNYKEAWDQFNATGRAAESEEKRVNTWKEADRNFGPIESYRFKRCTEDGPSGIVTCLFQLDYRDGATTEGKYVVARDGAGDWGISESKHAEPKKAK